MNLAEHINATGLSRADICAASGISRGMLSLIESGKRRIGVDKASAFAAALGIPVHQVRPDLAEMFGTASRTVSETPNPESHHDITPEQTTPDAA